MLTLDNPYLHELKIEVTHRCMLECIHCSGDAGENCDRTMVLSTCLDIIRQAHEMGVKNVVFSGGEPLLWDGIGDAVKYSAQHGLYVSLYSSGVIPDVNSQISNLASLGLNRMVFSLHGGKASTHEWVTRKRGSFLATKTAVQQSLLCGLETEFHFVPLKNNYVELEDICGFASKIGVDKVSVLRFVPQGRGANLSRHMLNQLQNLELRDMILRLRSRGYQVRTGSPYNFLRLSDDPHCYSGQDRLIVLPDTTIHPCDAFKQINAEELVGTADYSRLDIFSLEDCWTRSPYLNAVRAHVKNTFKEPCKSCSYLASCGSGCLAQKVMRYKKLVHSPDPMCLQSKEVTDD